MIEKDKISQILDLLEEATRRQNARRIIRTCFS